MTETFRDIILRAKLVIVNSRVPPPDTSAVEKKLDEFQTKVNRLARSNAESVASITRATTAATGTQIGKTIQQVETLQKKFSGGGLDPFGGDFQRREQAWIAARNRLHAFGLTAQEAAEYTKALRDEFERSAKAGEAFNASLIVQQASLQRTRDAASQVARQHAASRGSGGGATGIVPDPKVVEESAGRVQELHTRLRSLQSAYTSVTVAVPSFLLAMDSSASGMQRAAAGTLGMLSAAKGLTSALGPLGLVALPVVAGATAAYALRQQFLNEQLERAAQHEAELARITDRRIAAVEREKAVLEGIVRVREREIELQNQRRVRDVGDAADVAALHRDPLKRRAAIAAEERSLGTRAGGLESRLAAQELRRQRIAQQRPSDDDIGQLRGDAAVAANLLEQRRKLRRDLEHERTRFVTDEADILEKTREVNRIKRELSEVNAQIDRTGATASATRLAQAERQRVETDKKTKQSLQSSERIAAELAGVRGAQSRLSGAKIRTEFELSASRLQALSRLENVFLNDQRREQRLADLSPRDRARQRARPGAPLAARERERAFGAAGRLGFDRAAVDTQAEVAALIRNEQQRQEQLADAEVEQRRKQIESTNRAKDAAEDLGTEVTELAVRLTEAVDKATPALDLLYRSIDKLEATLRQHDEALRNK